MKLFPRSSSDYSTERSEELKALMTENYHNDNDMNQSYWYEAQLDSRFYSGDQSVFPEVYPNAPLNRRNPYSFNRIRRIIELISGHQQQNRKSTIVEPVTNGDQDTADQYTKVISHINRKSFVSETISSSFRDGTVTGLSLLYLWNDYSQDPVSGSLKVDALSFNSFLIDPFFRKPDLSDCNYLWKRTYLSKKQILLLLPDKKEMIEDLSETVHENIFTFMPEHDKVSNKGLMAYDEYYYLDTRTKQILKDSQTGETTEWTGRTEFGLQEFLKDNPTIVYSKTEVPTVKLAILIQGELAYDGPNPLGIDRYPFAPVFGYFDANINDYSLKLQSVTRGLRDAQYLYNRRKNIEFDIIESQVNSGFIYKEDSLVNPDDIHLRDQGKGIALKYEAQMTDVQQIQSAQLPPSMFQMSEIMAKEIQEISGVNEELLGSAVDDKAGVLSMLRQGAGLITLQSLFSQLDASQKLLGSLLLEAIQANYTPGKIKRIIGEEPTQQFYNKAFGVYDAAVVDGFDTTTQRAQEFSQLLRLKELGLPIPNDVIIEAATLQNKTKLIAKMEQEEQARQQAEQQSQQIQQQLQMSQVALADAKVQSDLSQAKERDSRVFSNIGLMDERRQEAEKDKTQSMLNLVKTLQEIDGVDMDQLIKLINMSKIVENQSSRDNNAEKLGSAIAVGATRENKQGVTR